jgi:hypothetical protein
MSDSQADFFDRLEVELRAAAERPPRRVARWSEYGRWTGAALAATAAVVLAVAMALVVLGGNSDDPGDHRSVAPSPPPVGSVIRRFGEEHIVVATGTAPVAGPWQVETYRSTRLADPETGEEYQPAGLPCLGIALLNPPPPTLKVSGACGSFPQTPGFSRLQHSVPTWGGAPGQEIREVLVYGRAPERATRVEITSRRGPRKPARTYEGPRGVKGDYYLAALPADFGPGRVNWLDRRGRPGSQGIRLITDTKGRLR